jgi:hypothetical protein
MGELGVKGSITVKLVVDKYTEYECGLGSKCSGLGPLAGFCKHGSEISGP